MIRFLEMFSWVVNKVGINESSNISTEEEEQLIDLRNYPFFQALFPQNSVDEFWLSAYKSYSMIGAKSTKIILPFVSSWVQDFLLWQKLKAKNERDFWNLRRNPGVLGNDGTSVQSYLFPKTSTPIAFALHFLKQLCFVVSVSGIFLNFLSAPQTEKVWESLV